MNRSSSLFLRAIVCLMGLGVFALGIFVLPNGIRHTNWNGYRPLLLGMYIPAIPFFIGLYQAWKLLNLIDKKQTFSSASNKALQKIKYCGIAIGTMYALGLPYIYSIAQQDDAPGIMLLGLVFTFVPLMIAVCAAILQNMFRNAIDIKTENDLTV